MDISKDHPPQARPDDGNSDSIALIRESGFQLGLLEQAKKHQQQIDVLTKQLATFAKENAELVKFKHYVEVAKWMRK